MANVLYFDGGASPNPGVGKSAYVLMSDTVNAYKIFDLGDGVTNNQAEWMGLIYGIKTALHYDIKTLKVIGDSQLVINQIQNKWKVKNENLKPLYEHCKQFCKDFDCLEYEWNGRNRNYAGILLEHGENKMKQVAGIL